MNKYYSVLTLLCLLDHNHPRPTAAPTIGFFLDTWTEKKFITPATQSATQPTTDTHTPILTIDPDSIITPIPPTIFGHNADTWMGFMTMPVFLNHVKNLQPHILRWPAGSGSDAYFWN